MSNQEMMNLQEERAQNINLSSSKESVQDFAVTHSESGELILGFLDAEAFPAVRPRIEDSAKDQSIVCL